LAFNPIFNQEMHAMSATLTPTRIKEIEKHDLIRQLEWRYATKKFDPSRKIDPRDWRTLEEALVLTPSSYGLQPWKFYVVNDPAIRAQLKGAAWGQSQITDASHLVVFTVKKDLGSADVDRLVHRVAAVRNVPHAALEGYRKMMVSAVSRPPEQVHAWAAKQAYIALGNFLTSAALLGIDACPMEGFEAAKFDEILGLDQQGYASVVIATAGYRAADDATARLAKVRFPHDELIQHVG